MLGGFLYGGVAGSGAAAGSFGASGACFAGFWWVGRCAQCCGKSSKPAPDTRGGEFAWLGGFFPGQSLVGDQGSGEPKLGVGGGDEPGPPVGLVGGAQSWGGPSEGVLAEPEGVLDIEAAQVGSPARVEVDRARAGSP